MHALDLEAGPGSSIPARRRIGKELWVSRMFDNDSVVDIVEIEGLRYL
jgi:hypothetical protein